jgi:hypothetical protein
MTKGTQTFVLVGRQKELRPLCHSHEIERGGDCGRAHGRFGRPVERRVERSASNGPRPADGDSVPPAATAAKGISTVGLSAEEYPWWEPQESRPLDHSPTALNGLDPIGGEP